MKGHLFGLVGGQAMKIIRRCLSFSSRLFAIQGNEDRSHEYFDLKIGIGKKKNWESEGDISLISSIRFFFKNTRSCHAGKQLSSLRNVDVNKPILRLAEFQRKCSAKSLSSSLLLFLPLLLFLSSLLAFSPPFSSTPLVTSPVFVASISVVKNFWY